MATWSASTISHIRGCLAILGLDLVAGMQLETVQSRYQQLLSLATNDASRSDMLSQAFADVVCFHQLRDVQHRLLPKQNAYCWRHEDFIATIEALLNLNIVGPGGQSIRNTLNRLHVMQTMRFQAFILHVGRVESARSVRQAQRILRNAIIDLTNLEQMTWDMAFMLNKCTLMDGGRKLIPRRSYAHRIPTFEQLHLCGDKEASVQEYAEDVARNIALGEMKEASTLRDDPEPSESKSARRRRLTAEQLAHKRELDRRAQRNNREKTRSRIAHLESLVEALQERDHERLVGQLDDQKAEIERLKGLLNSVANLVTGAEGIVPKTKVQRIEDAKTVDDIEQHRDSDSPDESPIKVEEDSPRPANENDLDSAPDVPALPQQPSLVNGNPVPQPVQNVVMRTQHQKESITQMATEIFNQENLEGKMWYICGVILRYILATTSPSQIRIENDEDIAIRAVFDGWSSVVERYPLDRGWQWLKEVDERIYFHRWPPFRLMHLRNCRLIFLRQIFGNTTKWHNPLPAFFTPRPAEENVPHDPLVEYFPWPGLRERMLFRPTMFATNKFMDNLRCEIEFLWGTDPHKLYCVDPIEGKYTYSEWFHERIEDIRFYPGTTDFFNSFPELKSDIPFLSNAVTSLKIGYTDDDKDISKGRRESLQSSRTLSELGHGLGV